MKSRNILITVLIFVLLIFSGYWYQTYHLSKLHKSPEVNIGLLEPTNNTDSLHAEAIIYATKQARDSTNYTDIDCASVEFDQRKESLLISLG